MAQRKNDEPEVTPRAVPLEPAEPVEAPALYAMGATFAERAKAIQSAENKAVGGAEKKSTRKSKS